MTQHQAPEVTSEMAPCPFCGSSDHLFVEPDEIGSGGQWVSPIYAGCCQQKGCGVSRCGDDTDEAITAWNTRATQPLSLTVDEGRLRDCLYELLDEHDPSCGHFDITHTAEKIAPLLLDRLQSLSGEQIAENANCSGDIDRSGLAQEVE